MQNKKDSKVNKKKSEPDKMTLLTKKSALGKGLGALMPSRPFAAAAKETVPITHTAKQAGESDKAAVVNEIAVERIQANRYQPRQEFDEAALEELKSSIAEYGIIQPLVVRDVGEGYYELIAGERRLRAAKLAGLKTVPVLIRISNDNEISELALIENIQRENLNAIEEARAYSRLIEVFKLTQDEVSRRIGRSRSYIANFLRLLKLSPLVQDYIANGALTMGQAKPLLAIEDYSVQEEAAEFILRQELSARDCERLVKKIMANPKLLQEKQQSAQNAAHETVNVHIREFEERLIKALGTKVRIKAGGKKNLLEIEFYSTEDLERLMDIFEERSQQSREDKLAALRRVSTQGFSV